MRPADGCRCAASRAAGICHTHTARDTCDTNRLPNSKEWPFSIIGQLAAASAVAQLSARPIMGGQYWPRERRANSNIGARLSVGARAPSSGTLGRRRQAGDRRPATNKWRAPSCRRMTMMSQWRAAKTKQILPARRPLVRSLARAASRSALGRRALFIICCLPLGCAQAVCSH